MKNVILLVIVVLLTSATTNVKLYPVLKHKDDLSSRTLEEVLNQYQDSIDLENLKMALIGNAYQRRLSPARIFWTKNLNQDDLRYYRDSATYMAPIFFNGSDINMAGVDGNGNAHFILHRNSKPGETAVFVIMKMMYGEYEDYPGQLNDAAIISGWCCNPFYFLRKKSVNKPARPVAPIPVSESDQVTLNNSGYNNQNFIHDTIYVDSRNKNQQNYDENNYGGQRVKSMGTTYIWRGPLHTTEDSNNEVLEYRYRHNRQRGIRLEFGFDGNNNCLDHFDHNQSRSVCRGGNSRNQNNSGSIHYVHRN